MALTFIRAIIIFITLVIVMRLMGKRQIGEMQPFEFVITLIIADLACVPMADVSIPLIYGIVGVLTLFVMHQLVSILEQSSSFFRLAVSGKPSVVIDKNGVNMKELKKNNMGIEELIESMRAMGYFSLDDLDYAIFESNGKLSALESESKSGGGLSVVVVKNGKVVDGTLKTIGTKKEDIESFVKSQGENVKRTEIMTVDGEGRVYYKAKNSKYRILKFGGGAKW
ncbi:MAG: DUF421 domain-containing protein [Clostridia bacterium]|nr:DUF421 domain-containing protein [Clostridia bacterium]